MFSFSLTSAKPGTSCRPDAFSLARRVPGALALPLILACSLLLGGCASVPAQSSPTSATAAPDARDGFWAGRLSMNIASEPPQSFSASFELRGRPERGELRLISPLGNVLGVLRWAPGEALLDQGEPQPQRFESVDALMTQATGAAVPVDALFGWLRGETVAVSGWTADLSRQPDGRIVARRSDPAPAADLRVVLER